MLVKPESLLLLLEPFQLFRELACPLLVIIRLTLGLLNLVLESQDLLRELVFYVLELFFDGL